MNKKVLGSGLILVCIILLSFITRGNEAALYIQPYLQNVTQTGITVQWWTYEAETSSVEYGDNNIVEASNDYIPSVDKVLHRAVLTNLKADTVYKYRIRSGSVVSEEYTFHTAIKRGENFHFAFLGDGRTDNKEVIDRHKKISALAWKQSPALAIYAGDSVDTGEQMHWDRFWRQIVTKSDPNEPGISIASNIPIYLVVGNHEIYNGKKTEPGTYDEDNIKCMERFKAYVDNPKNNSINPDWEERYYSFNYGVATFIVMDTNNTSAPYYDTNIILPPGSTPDWEPESEQYKWMIEELKKARENSVFTFIIMHPSPYCRGDHGDPTNPQSGYNLRALDSIFRKFGVSAVLTSHDHMVEHCLTGPEGYESKMDLTSPENLNYIIMGNSGEGCRYAQPGWEKWMSIKGNGSPPYYTTYFYDWSGSKHCSFLDVSVEKKEKDLWAAKFRIIRDDEQVFDEFSLERNDPLLSKTKEE